MSRVPATAICALLSFAMLGAGCTKKTPPATPLPPLSLGASAYGLPQARMEVNGKQLIVEVARTPTEKAQGLSGRVGLAEGMGMLFVFDEPLIPSFWMKEMTFFLDMIWIRDGQVIDISSNVPHPDPAMPLQQLPTYSPREPVSSVLEVPAGWAQKNEVSIGSAVTLPIIDQ